MKHLKIVLIFAWLLALGTFLADRIFFFTGDINKSNLLSSSIDLILRVVLITLGIIFFRKSNGNYLTLYEAVKIGIGIALIAGIIIFVGKVISTNFLLPEENILENNRAASTEKTLWDSVYFTAALELFINLIIALVISLLAGAIMQKNKDFYE